MIFESSSFAFLKEVFLFNNIWLIVREISGNLNFSPFTLWLSGRAGIVEVQVPSISHELAQSSRWRPATLCFGRWFREI